MNVVGVLTAGGDCPGLNAVIRAVVVRATEKYDADVVGIRNGWEGLMQGRTRPLDRDDVRGILARGGTILGTSRLDPYVHGDGYESVRKTIEANDMDALIVIGGDTLWSAAFGFSGMSSGVNLFELADGDLGVDCSCLKLDVTEHRLDVAYVGSVLQHQRRHRMAKQMARTAFADPG